MKVVKVTHISDRLLKKMYWWCQHSFGPGGENQDWLLDDGRFVFWEDSYFTMFLLRWNGQSD